ncbi:MAG: lactate utilization protein [Kiritimatiellae bacterium]|nr:lactate utilization protein [Kiritimatiellia bacterium]
MDKPLEEVAEALRRRGFVAECFASGADAAARAVELAADAKSVGFGGSVTVKSLGLVEAMSAKGKEILRHGDPKWSPEEKMDVMRRELTCDLFLTSANALTADGRIVNIDGNGNRVAASIFGPRRVVFVVGRNKIVDGGIDAAIDRIKREACPPNCRRLDKKTPCAATGVCADCSSPDRICKVTVVLDRRPSQTDASVLLVDEDLGY